MFYVRTCVHLSAPLILWKTSAFIVSVFTIPKRPPNFSNEINVFSQSDFAFGGKTSVFNSLFFIGDMCSPSSILVLAHLVYIRYLLCFSPHCNKPKCCTVHLPNTLCNGRDHSGISSHHHGNHQTLFFVSSSPLPPLSYSSLLHLFANSLFTFNL